MKLFIKRLLNNLSTQSLYIYNNLIESLFRTTVLAISWFFGILYNMVKNDNANLASNCIVFSLPLLIDFCMLLSKKGRIIHKITCILIILILTISFCMMSKILEGNAYKYIIFCLSLLILVIVVVIFLVQFFASDSNEKINYQQDTKKEIISEKLEKGKLGSLEEKKEDK